jgi:citrate lyase beta subunit
VRYFQHLSSEEQQSIFFAAPASFTKHSDRELLSHALGALLYMPGTRNQIADEIVSNKHRSLVSMVVCLEDAIGDNQVEEAENTLVAQINQISLVVNNGKVQESDIPLIFVRVREPEQIKRITNLLGENCSYLTGFVFPKFSVSNAEEYFQTLVECNKRLGMKLYGMPILESPEIIYKETRIGALVEIRRILEKYRDLVLNVRIGATDFSSLFGLRRSYNVTIYDISVIRDCIVDIVNILGRRESGYVISGPVWEYFNSQKQVGKVFPKYNQPDYEEGLIREVLLDKENGLFGKTIIHPSHLKVVQSLYVVSYEEYMDAKTIMANNNGNLGVIKSDYENKMNEIKPHLSWAKKILTRAQIYGVYHAQYNYTNMLIEKAHV